MKCLHLHNSGKSTESVLFTSYQYQNILSVELALYCTCLCPFAKPPLLFLYYPTWNTGMMTGAPAAIFHHGAMQNKGTC